MVIDFSFFAYVSIILQQEGTILKRNVNGKHLFCHIAAMHQLHDVIFDSSTKPWSNKRKTNEKSVYSHVLKTVEFLRAMHLEA